MVDGSEFEDDELHDQIPGDINLDNTPNNDNKTADDDIEK